MTMSLRIAEPDHSRSPLTGWTRDHWEACADHLIAGAVAHSSPAGARVRFPGTTSQDATAALEGFARAFLLGTLRLAGSCGEHSLGLTVRYAEALDAGTLPGHVEAWPTIDHHDQTLVEATAIAVGLHWSRPWLWDPLPDPTKQRLISWLSGARNRWCADNNHVMFGATVQAFLASVGADHDDEAIDGALNRIEEWYVGDGWYSDGVGRRFDHYNGWTFHLYPFLIEQMLGGVSGGARGTTSSFDVFRTRLRMFLDDYQHLFDASGNPVLQGRSLIYRWGMAAPFWMGEIQGSSPLAPGRTRRLASGMLSGFVDAGTLDNGVLGLGWKRPAPDLLQSYNSPGSPLWASKGFLGLLLPAEHAVWKNIEEPLPAEQHDFIRPMGGPRWLAIGRRDDGIVRLLNHGSDGHPRRADPLYRRLSYSSATVPVQLDGLDDNAVAVGTRGAPSEHRGLRSGVVRRDGAASKYRLDAQGRDIRVDVATLVLESAELRMARFRGVLDQQIRCTGWAISADEPLRRHTDSQWSSATNSEGLLSAMAWVDAPRSGSASGPRAGVAAGPHANALGDFVALPWLEIDAGSEGELHLAWIVYLGRHWESLFVDQLSVRWLPDGAVVQIAGDRRHCAWLRESPWRADEINQGIFRVGSAALGD